MHAASTYGQEFFVGFMQNIAGSILTQLELTIGTPAESANVVIETLEGEIHSTTIAKNSPAVFTILDLQVISHDFFNRQKGIRIATTDEEPIFVLGANRIDFLNYATFLAYPCELDLDLDSKYEYLVTSVDHATLNSQFLLVGCSADTHVTIIPTQNVLLPQDTQDMDSDDSLIMKGQKHNVTLNQMDTLLVSSGGLDLSGTRIVSNKPLTVISGHECANVPQTAFDCEPIAVQIPPVKTWGTEFLVAGYAGRTSEQLNFGIVPSEENITLLSTCGQSTLLLLRTSFQYAVNSREPFCYFEFSKPVFLTQLASGRSTDGLGDPAISIVSPIDQYINKIEFLLLPTNEFPTSYISITVPPEHYDPAKILLDGEMIDCYWMAIYNRTNDIVGYGCNVSMPADSSTSPTQHSLSHSDSEGRFSATVYGFRPFPPQGYAYLTGQKIEISSISG